jgi:flagellar motility protein MotE (MotC chaperone)
MKKLMPILRLAFFCIAIFAISFGALLLKEGKLFAKNAGDPKNPSTAQKPDGGDDAGANGDRTQNGGEESTTKASIDGGSGADRERPGDGRAPKGKAVDAATRQKALTTGRALFDVAQPISIAEASDLMLELARTRREYEERSAALDLREKMLDQFSAELEQKRSAILKIAGDAQSSGAGVVSTGTAEVLDKKTLAQIGKIFEKMQPPSAAAHALGTYAPDRAAQILMNMKDQAVADILSQMPAADLVKITDAIGKLKTAPADEEK